MSVNAITAEARNRVLAMFGAMEQAVFSGSIKIVIRSR
jgi:hypothetical protein